MKKPISVDEMEFETPGIIALLQAWRDDLAIWIEENIDKKE